jgi:D-serine deaminase-like pyridoxal phosphate-dependent protein
VNLPHPTEYAVADAATIPTPALLIYTERVDGNIRAVIARCGGDPARWRPHVKTAKARNVMARFLVHGITRFKCATTMELRVLLDLGAADVLVSFPVVGATAQRVRSLAAARPASRVSVLIESAEHLGAFAGSGLGVFIDCNPGMDRTGLDPADAGAIAALVRQVTEAKCEFRGLHWYDGHLHGLDLAERTTIAHQGYAALGNLVARLAALGVVPTEVIVAGTPAAPCALSYVRWREIGTDIQISPGTVVYNDTTSLEQLPAEWGLKPAALVLTSVVSHPRPGRVTCDAGHKSVSADAGVPTCAVLGHADWTPARPSEEHLPIDCPSESGVPAIGTTLLLLPRHICPTVNNFDEALLIRDGRVEGVTEVSARGHDGV